DRVSPLPLVKTPYSLPKAPEMSSAFSSPLASVRVETLTLITQSSGRHSVAAFKERPRITLSFCNRDFADRACQQQPIASERVSRLYYCERPLTAYNTPVVPLEYSTSSCSVQSRLRMFE
ncbi:unnamed protein product, partial [Trichogramma brassicae]